MRIINLLLLISLVCLASAKYLPDENSSRVLIRNKRSLNHETDNTLENHSSEGEDDNDKEDNDSFEPTETEKLHVKCAEELRKLQAKKEKEERKRVEQLPKEQRKTEKLEAKIKEEERKLQEKLEKEERKREEKLAKEELKRAEKNAKEERKRQEKISKELEKLEKKSLESENKSVDSSESAEDLDFEDIWKKYIYQKYDLTEDSTDLEKDAAVNKYIQEELSLNVNSTKQEYRQAVLQLVNNKLLGDNSTSNFQNYFVSHVNAVYIQQLQADIEHKIAELDNDTALLQNVSSPWAPEAKQAIGEEKSVLTSIAQFLSDIVPTWIIGGKPTTPTSLSTSGTSPSAVANIATSNAGTHSNDDASLVSTLPSNNIRPVDGTVIATESANFSKPSVEDHPTIPNASISPGSGLSPNIDSVNAGGVSSVVHTVPSEAGLNINSNIDATTSSSKVDLNDNSVIGQSSGSPVDSNDSAVTGTTSILGLAVSEVSVTNDILVSNAPAGNSPSGNIISNADTASSVLNTVATVTDLSINSIIDVPPSSSNVDLNENSEMGQSVGSTVDSNGFAPISTASVSGSAVLEVSITNDISPSNPPAGNSPSGVGASSVLSSVTSNASLSINTNIDGSTSFSNVDLNENSIIDQSPGSTVYDNLSVATGATSVSTPVVSEKLPTDISPSINAISNVTQAADVKPVEVSNDVEASSGLPLNVSFSNTPVSGLSDSQSTESSIFISASPSAESSLFSSNVSTGSEAPISSVISEANANAQVSNDNLFIANSHIQTVATSEISNKPFATQASVNTDNSVNMDALITSSINTVSNVVSDLSNGGETTETASSNNELPDISIMDATSTGGQVADSVASGTGSSVNIVNGASLGTISAGTEVAVENTSNSTDLSMPLNIENGPSSITSDVSMTATDPTVATPPGDAVSVIGLVSVPISAANDVIVQNNEDNPVDTISNAQVIQEESTNIFLTSSKDSSDTTTVDAFSVLTGTEKNIDTLPLNSETSVTTDITLVSSGTNESVSNPTDLVPATTEITVITPTLVPNSISQEPISEVPVVVEEVTDTSKTVIESSGPSVSTDITVVSSNTDEAIINAVDLVDATSEVTAAPDIIPVSDSQEPTSEVPVIVAEVTDTSATQSSDSAITVIEPTGPEVITNVSTAVNDAYINKDVSVSIPEEIANTPAHIVTQTSPSENEVPEAVTVVFDSSVDVFSNVAEELPSSTVNIALADGESSTVSSANATTASSITIDSPIVVETLATEEVESIPVSSDSVSSFTSANDMPGSETVGTNSGSLDTSNATVTTELPQVAQNTNTPTVPEEVGASLLEVSQQ